MRTLIVVLGNAGSGKTTAVNTISHLLNSKGIKNKVVKFAQPLYNIHNLFFKDKKRWFLLLLGNIISLFHLRRFICKKWSNTVKEAFTNEKNDIVLCDDLRFPLEGDTIVQLGVGGVYHRLIFIYANTSKHNCMVRSNNTKKQMNHDSELYINELYSKFHYAYGPYLTLQHILYYDVVIPNNDDKVTYVNAINKYIEGIL